MVQKEIRKKTRIYGTVAMVSAIVLVALIYVFGSVPGTFTPDSPTPNLPNVLANVSPMQTFKNYDELKSFLTANTEGDPAYYGGGPLDAQVFGSARSVDGAPEPAPMTESGNDVYSSSSPDYSTTNIQVAGVDEADIVKTDGKHIYVASNNFYSASQNNVYILKADPQDPRVIAEIALGNETYIAGLFLSQDSNKLVVLGSQYQAYAYGEPRPEIAMIYPYYSNVNTFLAVYDVSEKDSPVLARNLTLSGSYFNSRMIGDYVYAVVSQPAYLINDNVVLPQVYENAKASEITPSRIYYTDVVEPTYFTFTTFIGLNILDDVQEPTNMTVMMGGASTMYVSPGNIYVTYPTWSQQGQYTSIYRVSVNGSVLTFEAKGNATGYMLNQYSMDEYNGYFRLATTSQNKTQQNNIYVLDMNLTVVGKLENLALNERIYSTRFIGDKCYLVTFRQVDPFFIIDLSSPTAPKVAGELKIPGYSSYLHPYDENHVIGLGMEGSNVKLSLFDVSDANNPKEMAKYIVEGDWTDSQALQDPHAFLFNKEKELLVIPISKTNYGVIDKIEDETFAHEGGFWLGAYIFKLTTNGFTLRGGITHAENVTSLYSYAYDYNQQVNRALYIGNTLYTVSNLKVKLNSLETLALIAEVNLR